MKTKEAIDWLDKIWYAGGGNKVKTHKKTIADIIALLKRGEKFEAMWGELEDSLEPEGNPDYLGDIGDYNACLFMKNIEQKHFPKEVKK